MAFENFNTPQPQGKPQAEPQQNVNMGDGNNSGQGPNTPVPDVVAKRFNWGACLLNWIWGLGNKTYITLLIFLAGFIPIVGIFVIFGMQIWFGIKGNTWAWQNKRFQSIVHFHQNQRKWAIAGVILSTLLISLALIGIVAALTLPSLMTNTDAVRANTMTKKGVATVQEVVLMNEAIGEKCDLTADGIAKCFEKRMNVASVNGSTLNAADGTVWTFIADGICKDADACKLTVSDKGNELFTLSLYTNDNGHLKLDNNEINEILNIE